MPYIKDKNLVNIYEEVDKANQTIHDLEKSLKEEEENNAVLRKHRVILGVVGLLFLILFLWSFLPGSDSINKKKLIENNQTIVNNDSIYQLREELAAANARLAQEESNRITDRTIVYSVQIGAFNNFKAHLFSDELTTIKEFKEGGFNKYAVGNFVTYEEARILKEDLRRMGFKDCFIIAQSYGQRVDIKEALQLSEETQYLN
ncbi:MAG: hypothetical protein CR985_03680 [Flavobacteriales bacterium]|nr:MAG: hypothetical protein CR985_03680 [Flavobacteriales bacterium]